MEYIVQQIKLRINWSDCKFRLVRLCPFFADPVKYSWSLLLKKIVTQKGIRNEEKSVI